MSPSGRAKQCKTCSGDYQSYTADFKRQVVLFAENSNSFTAQREFSVNEKLIRGWRKQRDQHFTCNRRRRVLSRPSNREALCSRPCVYTKLPSMGDTSSTSSLRGSRITLEPAHRLEFSITIGGEIRCVTMWTTADAVPVNLVPGDRFIADDDGSVFQPSATRKLTGLTCMQAPNTASPPKNLAPLQTRKPT
ncbi:hypothetical protein HPB49_010978 [Dermacentor silvarum]|uniref:Uncharacterized protein n=1 Tax=Dermacentor silvarum TaxID=543639 RepID=A0ACB8CWS9_DERSI|nr:hypothetical protein HPB49_010978 [Dermacentor silvarum]